MITIYNFPRGARGLRVMWQCEEMGLAYRVEQISFPPPPSYLALNPLGTVPFLEDDSGAAMNESVAMMFYLAHRYGPTPLLPGKDDPALACVFQMTVFGEASIGAGIFPIAAARFGAPQTEKHNWSVRTQKQRVEQNIRYVADTLGANPFLAGNIFTLADISVSCALLIWRGAADGTLPDILTAYQERMAARPACQRANARCTGSG